MRSRIRKLRQLISASPIPSRVLPDEPMTVHELVRALRHHPYTQAWRAIVLHRDGYRCTECGSSSDRKLEVDHVYPLARLVSAIPAESVDRLLKAPGASRFFDPANGRTLCGPCHRRAQTGS